VPSIRVDTVLPAVPRLAVSGVERTRDILRRTVEFIQNNINSTTI
jgi:hypothetical protein